MAKSSNTRPPARTTVRPAAERKPRAVKRTVASGDVAALDPEEIAGRAYELFLADGGGHGHDVDHWLQAESELKQRRLTSAA
jgi:hypothetical protein